MFRCWRREPERPNYAKIFAITVSVVAAASAVALVIYKLFNKYFKLVDNDTDDFIDDGCDDCDVCIEAAADSDEQAHDAEGEHDAE